MMWMIQQQQLFGTSTSSKQKRPPKILPQQPNHPPPPPIPMAYDLDVYIPRQNAPTTFQLDHFRFFLLQDALMEPIQSTTPTFIDGNSESTSSSSTSSSIHHHNHQQQQRWKVPNITDPTNEIPPAVFRSTWSMATAENRKLDPIQSRHICQIVCQFDKNFFAYIHFPHFLQQALPCYNIFHHFAKHAKIPPQSSSSSSPLRHNYMILPSNVTSPNNFIPYIQEFIKVMEGPPYYVHMIYGFNESIPVHKDCHNVPVVQPLFHNNSSSSNGKEDPLRLLSSASSSHAILAVKSFADTGWHHPNRYFLAPETTVDALLKPQQHNSNNNDDDNFKIIQQIQQSVLGDLHYHAGPASFDFDDALPPRPIPPMEQIQYRIVQVLILDRRSSSRDFVYVNETIHALQNYRYQHRTSIRNNHIPTPSSSNIHPDDDNTTATTITTTHFRFNVTYIPSFNTYSLQEQAYCMHHADIIYSPHGAQLSNLMYVRPCTVSVEFFPRAYYLQFFQPLAVAAHGLSYEGYPSATINYTDKIADSQMMEHSRTLRYAARKSRMSVAPEFFTRTLPQIMNATIQCRAKY